MQAAMTTATASMSANIATLQSQFASLAASISGTATQQQAQQARQLGGGGGGGSKTGDAVNTVANVLSAISNIIGNVQMAHINTALGLIEHNTRYFQIEAEKYFQTDEWDRHYGLLDKLDGLWESLRDIVAALGHLTVNVEGGGTQGAEGAGGPGGGGLSGGRTPAGPAGNRPAAFQGGQNRETQPGAPPPISLLGLEPGATTTTVIAPPVSTSTAAPSSSAPGASSTVLNAATSALTKATTATGQLFDQIVNLPHFQGGGYVPHDMLAHLDAGEVVVPAGAVNRMATNNNTSSVGDVTIHVNGAQDPRETARQIANYMKTLQPRMSSYST
jgi:hypothetical protein